MKLGTLIMKDLENYVCTFEQAKKLKTLGAKQNSLFYYSLLSANPYAEYVFQLKELHPIKYIDRYFISSFTSQELVELISELGVSVMHKYIHILADFKCKSEAQTRAEFLIYELETRGTYVIK